jgi:hypothetical protein
MALLFYTHIIMHTESIANDSQGSPIYFGKLVLVTGHNPFLGGTPLGTVTGQSGGGWELFVQNEETGEILLIFPKELTVL